MFKSITFTSRASRTPRVTAPFGARLAGHIRLRAPEEIAREPGDFVRLFWAKEGRGVFRFPNRELELEANGMVLFPADHHHRLVVKKGVFEYFWLHMDGPLARDSIGAFGFEPYAPVVVGPPMEECFDRIGESMKDVGLPSEWRTGTLLHDLLSSVSCVYHVGEESRAGSAPLIDRAARHVFDNFMNPELSVESLAREFGLHRSRFSRQFRASRGVSPVQFIQSVRVRHALAMLRQSDRPVGEIARLCGFGDASYFSRTIRAVTGQSPRDFRKRER